MTCLPASALLPWLTSLPVRLSPQEVRRLGSSLDAAFPPRAGTATPLTLESLDLHRGRRGATTPRAAAPPTRSRRPAASPRGGGRRQPAKKSGGGGLPELILKLAAMAFVLLVVLPAALQALSENLQEDLAPPTPPPPATAPVAPAP